MTPCRESRLVVISKVSFRENLGTLCRRVEAVFLCWVYVFTMAERTTGRGVPVKKRKDEEADEWGKRRSMHIFIYIWSQEYSRKNSPNSRLVRYQPGG